jgi:hypothetical protein
MAPEHQDEFIPVALLAQARCFEPPGQHVTLIIFQSMIRLCAAVTSSYQAGKKVHRGNLTPQPFAAIAANPPWSAQAARDARGSRSHFIFLDCSAAPKCAIQGTYLHPVKPHRARPRTFSPFVIVGIFTFPLINIGRER